MKNLLLTIYGASGDLAKLKLFPAIYVLAKEGKLPEDFVLVGFARSKSSREEFCEMFRQSVLQNYKGKVKEEIIDNLLTHVYYFQGDYNKANDFVNYRQFLTDELKLDLQNSTQINYFSVPPDVFEHLSINIAFARVSKDEDIRLVIEKPFGLDGKSASRLRNIIGENFEDKQIFLLDHYLGKNTIASILKLRKSNRILSTMLDGNNVASIQINALEKLGVEERLGYFDKVGIIRDFVQSHILQILSLFTMSVPVSDSAENLRREKYTILCATEFVEKKENILLGQYNSYKSADKKVSDSHTETFAWLQLQIDRQEWQHVPIYIKVGKKMNETLTNIVIEFKKYDFQPKDEPANRLILTLKPEEKLEIELRNSLYEHDQKMNLKSSFICEDGLCASEHAQLLLEVINDEKINFLSFEEVLASWEVIDDIQMFIASENIKPVIYDDFSKGPEDLGSKIYDLRIEDVGFIKNVGVACLPTR